MEFVSNNFLQNVFPDGFLQPDAMVIHILGKPHLVHAVGLSWLSIDLLVALVEQKLGHVEDSVDNFKIDVSLVNDRSQKILEQLTEGLQARKAHDLPRRSNWFQILNQLKPYLPLMEGEDELAHLFLGGNDFFLLQAQLPPVDNVVNHFQAFVLIFLEFIHFFQFFISHILKLFGLLSQKLLIPLQILAYQKWLKLGLVFARIHFGCSVEHDE